jgi:hypothetical protein
MADKSTFKDIDRCQTAILDAIENYETGVLAVALTRVLGGIVGGYADPSVGPKPVMTGLFDHALAVANETHRLIASGQNSGGQNDQ